MLTWESGPISKIPNYPFKGALTLGHPNPIQLAARGPNAAPLTFFLARKRLHAKNKENKGET